MSSAPVPPGRWRHRQVLLAALVVAALALDAAGARAGCPVRPLGDLTGDGELRLADAVRLSRIVTGLEAASAVDSLVGDCSPRPGSSGRPVGDGQLDEADLDRLLDLLLGGLGAMEFHGTPTVSAIWPRFVTAGDSVPHLWVFGSGFTSACSLGVDPAPGVRFSNIVVHTDSLMEASLSVDTTATPGTRDVSAASLGGTSPPHSDARLTIFPSGGPPPSLLAVPRALRLVAGGGLGSIMIETDPPLDDSTAVQVSVADPSIAEVSGLAAVHAGSSSSSVAVLPRAVGTTTVQLLWQGASAQVGVEVVAAEIDVWPASLALFQTGLLDSLEFFVTPQTDDCVIILQCSDPGIAAVPPSVTVPGGDFRVKAAVTPGMVAGDVTVTAQLPAALGGAQVGIPVHVEPLMLTLVAAEPLVTLQDDVVKDDPMTPGFDEGLGIGTSGVILALNGASRLPQMVMMEAFPTYVPGVSSGFATLPNVVIPPNQTFWAHHFGGIIEGASTPPFGGTVRARLLQNPIQEASIPAFMSYGPPMRQALRFCDTQVDYVPGQTGRMVVAIADQANAMLEQRPSWEVLVTGGTVQVDTMTNDTRAALFLMLTPLAPGSSQVIVRCSPGLEDTLRVNVLAPEMILTTQTAGTLSEQSDPLVTEVVEVNGIQVTQLAHRLLVGVRLQDAVGPRGFLDYGPAKDIFVSPGNPKPDDGPDIAMGSTPVLGVSRAIDVSTDPQLSAGQLKTLVWDFRDKHDSVVRPGRYVYSAFVHPPPKNQSGDANMAVMRGGRVSIAVNMAQVVWLDFNKDFPLDLKMAGDLGPAAQVMGDIAGLIEREYRDQDSINVRVTTERPLGDFEYTTLEIGGPDPNPSRDAFGRASPDLCNQNPGQAIRPRPQTADYEGIFTRVLYGWWANLRSTGPMKADFDTVFKQAGNSTYDRGIATKVFGNMIATTAIHELTHSFGLVPGPAVADFSHLRNTPYQGEAMHNERGKEDTGEYYMDGGLHITFRETAMIDRGASPPFSLGEIGMTPNDHSIQFNALNLKCLRRLLPRGAVVR